MIRMLAWLLSQPLFWAVLGVIFGPVLFLRGFRLLQRKRLILDIPPSTVRAAALGPVEISGKAVGPYTLVAPLSQTECLYYRIAVRSNPKRDFDNPKMRELSAPLYVDDGTGKVLVYPAHCELQLEASEERAEFGKAALALEGYEREGAEFVQEYCIRPGDQLYVLGNLQQNGWAKPEGAAESSELSRIGPGFVSPAEADLLRHGAYPTLDPTLPSGMPAAPDEFDYHPPVILIKGNGPFVISTHSEREIVENLSWKSFLYIWGGPLAALWGLWQIFSRAKAAGILGGNF
ncbi:MAG TPA: hypothetical protein VFA67_08200 [Candidatus Sulfotelmatobacter sp.]|nr:hypothetical protein [Candidatus Sulfotelmatobacter sp.]